MATDRTWDPFQVDFSGGIVSERVINRMDIEQYKTSVLEMLNVMPTLQGPALRAPGSHWLRDVGENARLIPYLAVNGDPALLILRDGFVDIMTNPQDQRSTSSDPGTGADTALTWDPNINEGGFLDFSNGDLTVTRNFQAETWTASIAPIINRKLVVSFTINDTVSGGAEPELTLGFQNSNVITGVLPNGSGLSLGSLGTAFAAGGWSLVYGGPAIWNAGDVISFILDFDTAKGWIAFNGTPIGGDPVLQTTPQITWSGGAPFPDDVYFTYWINSLYGPAGKSITANFSDTQPYSWAGYADGAGGSGGVDPGTGFRKQIVPNPEFFRALNDWSLEPARFYGGENNTLGCFYTSITGTGALEAQCRDWRYPQIDNETTTVKTTVNVDIASDFITVDYRLIYADNPSGEGLAYRLTLKVGTTEGASDVFERVFSDDIVGTIYENAENAPTPTTGFTGLLYIELFSEALEYASHPVFRYDRLQIFSAANPPPAVVTLPTVFTADMLDDIQYVQSPYGNKEVVLVHRDVHPQWLFFDSGGPNYVIGAIPFVGPPTQWQPGNYPGVCTSYQGRLILAATYIESETVWGSASGDWPLFTVGTNPADPIIFTSIYRSPILWAAGHKELLLGSQEFEYIVGAKEGLLIPGDIDVRLHSTHGSARVQPVPMGYYVAFASERGTRLRAAQLTEANQGWISPDLTLWASNTLDSRVKRMSRMRNPHHMIFVVAGNGQGKLYSEDPYVGINGWSDLDVGGDILDVAILADDNGVDIAYMLVKRVIDSQTVYYLEAIFDWTFFLAWRYMGAYRDYVFNAPTHILGALGHLEGQNVQVVGNGSYLGSWPVVGGQIDMTTPDGLEFNVTTASVGTALQCHLRSLPPVVYETTGGLGAAERYSDIRVRTLGSTRPIVNGERPPERDPTAPMDQSQELDQLHDSVVVNLGWEQQETILVEENVPFKLEILSISGKLGVNKL